MAQMLKRSHGKQIVYRYNGDPSTDKIVNDPTGVMLRHAIGEMVNRNGKQWKVVAFQEELDVKGPLAVPIHHVYLTDAV